MIDDVRVAELLDQYMDELGLSEQWITVYDFRTYFQLDEATAPVIAGFLRRLRDNTRYACRYRVEKIEPVRMENPHTRWIKRYFVRKRPPGRKKACRTRLL